MISKLDTINAAPTIAHSLNSPSAVSRILENKNPLKKLIKLKSIYYIKYISFSLITGIVYTAID